jgi:tetratricopeptide (TPR) repeat protein
MSHRKTVQAVSRKNSPSDGEANKQLLGGLTQGRVLFLIIAITTLVYANSLGGQFLVDDPKQIVNNPSLRSWSNVITAFTSDVWSFQRGITAADIPPPYYRPIFTIYFTVAYKLFGLWEPGWHLLNLLVHVIATVAVFHLVRRLSSNLAVASLAALFFGIHPTHVESVSWISGIPDPLAALFYVPSLSWYVRGRTERNKKWIAASLVAYALALLCKETPIVLPLVVAAWELSRRDIGSLATRARETALATAPFIGVAILYLIVRVQVLGFVSWKHPVMAQVSDSAVATTMPYVVVSYLRHLVAPFNLSLLYGTSIVSSVSDSRFLMAILVLGGIALLLWIYRRYLTTDYVVAMALLFAPLLPVLNLRVFHREYLIQDRYLYLPSIGFCFLLALVIVRLAERRKALALALAAAVAIAFCIGTVLHNRVWNDGVALWSRAIAHVPTLWSPHYNLGLAYMKEQRYQDARDSFINATRYNASVAAVYNSLALAQDKLGDEATAVSNLEHALKLDPTMQEARNNLGAMQFRRGEVAAAAAQFERALERDPRNESVRFNLARVKSAQGDQASAISLFEELLAATPSDAEVRYHLALSYAATGRKREAATHLNRALADERVAERAAAIRAALDKLQ